jgi:hypothetical protein
MQPEKEGRVKPTVVFDIEIYVNYMLVSFMNVATGNVRHFEMYPGKTLEVEPIRAILRQYRLVSFNGIQFDLPLVTLALNGATCEQIKNVANQMILNGLRYWSLGIEPVKVDHIDLIEVAPGQASLKLYGGRLHCQTLQDLPIEPEAVITPDQHALLRRYCENDLRTTLALYERLQPQLRLREEMSEQYRIDLRSKSDAQIAEAVIKDEVEHRLKHSLKKCDPFRLAGHEFSYRPPSFIRFNTQALRDILHLVSETVFVVGSNGVVQLPKNIVNLKINVGSSTYRMGIGGLHSSEKSIAHHSDDNFILVDRDVTSYYPSIILRCGLKPENIGEHFTHVYRHIVERRLTAKINGDKVQADCLKVTINGSFGKFGSPYSCLYSPALLIQTTVTGQLTLLMLIEALESEGIQVVSANTDGLVIRSHRNQLALLDYIVWEWEHSTGFVTESSEYLALYSRDVNNYVAITPNGYKAKGAMAKSSLSKNPQNEIVTRAVIEYLRHATPVETTIHSCQDITQFVTVRTVKGGAVKDGKLLGKAVRWYYAKDTDGAIHYRLNNYTVPRTEGAQPLMELPNHFPADVDLDWYIREASSVLNEIGAFK